ncbi:hypothetical protein DVV91_16805 [Clostridium botulinum]|uniref:hypothetical protein n=1 Tax=Clostridium botulinum TaxID=1491 RepID=UPI0013F11F79|nr:hypothetical protein [Clostridium botulinum]MBN1075983.1 hypothetical protein [Clostridium botulinum]NFL34479.1 hypothetical protein [Clostridium botulinum]NFM04109.1 hypothetical protein [Clostridium botulinum]NFO41943.1 hypothetical protein [Clostridium botulinum]
MEESKIKVYIKLDKNNCIIEINSSIFLENIKDYICIDEGVGDRYSHAQNYYFEGKKPLRDVQGRCNYKYIDNKIIELTDEEKEKLYLPVILKPNPQELINAQLLKSNADTQLQLKNQILVNAELVKQIAELKGGN